MRRTSGYVGRTAFLSVATFSTWSGTKIAFRSATPVDLPAIVESWVMGPPPTNTVERSSTRGPTLMGGSLLSMWIGGTITVMFFGTYVPGFFASTLGGRGCGMRDGLMNTTGVGGASAAFTVFACVVAAIAAAMSEPCTRRLMSAPPRLRCRPAFDSMRTPNMSPPWWGWPAPTLRDASCYHVRLPTWHPRDRGVSRE